MKRQIRKISKMSFRSSKRQTAVQAAELILADSVEDSGPLSDFSSDGEDNDTDQTAIQNSDSDAFDAGLVVSDSESKKKMMLPKTAMQPLVTIQPKIPMLYEESMEGQKVVILSTIQGQSMLFQKLLVHQVMLLN